MLFPDRALARRLEMHEAWSAREHARTQVRLYPETGASAQPAAEGYAIFCGRNSPLSQVYGWGASEPVRSADLDGIEAFFRDRGLRTRIRACPFSDPSLFHLLGERGYGVGGFMNVFARSLDGLDGDQPALCGVRVGIAVAKEARGWFERYGAGGDWAEPDGVAFMTIRTAQKADTQLFLAWIDGQPAGGGALEMHDGVAALMAADTLPAYRKRGLHTLLLHARLTAAIAAGCDLALVHTAPGSASQNNVLRAGFQLAYTALTLVSPA